MNCKIFGFVGVESYDLAFYSAKTAIGLGRKSLILDLTGDRNVACIFHGPVESSDVVNVSGIDIAVGKLEKGLFNGYDYIFIVMDFHIQILDLCDEIYFFTTFQKNHVNQLKKISVPDVPRFLVLRDRAAVAMNHKGILQDLKHLDIVDDDIFDIEDTDYDIEAKVLLHYSTKVKVARLSQSMFAFVKHLFDTDASNKEITNAWKLMQKG